MDLLRQIIDERRRDAQRAERTISARSLRDLARGRNHHSLVSRLARRKGTCIVAEMKKASPSAGLLRKDYRPGETAREYRRAGAVGISVLTEPRHFLGSGEHLWEARRAVDLPILRKDFVGDVYHIYETAAWGADVVLLIVAALERGLLEELCGAAEECGLEVLAEAHSEADLETALGLRNAIVGINSRNLRTLKTDLGVARRLAGGIPDNRVCIAESGIRTRKHIEDLEGLGYDGFLIGEALMRSVEPALVLAQLMGKRRVRKSGRR
jgi:indole-3-glycerol phosphate synthase